MAGLDVKKHVLIVGAGFAGLACARKLAKQENVRVTLIDKNNYHQFQPLLYQVATSALSPEDVAFPVRDLFRKMPNVDVKMEDVVSADSKERTVTTASGKTYKGDYLVLAAGSRPNFFNTPGAEHAFPLYALEDAEKLRSRIIACFEDADCNRDLIKEGALNFVIVGGGATGAEISGAISDMIRGPLLSSYPDLALSEAKVMVYDLGKTLLAPFSEHLRQYATETLEKEGVSLHLETSIVEIGPGYVVDSNKNRIKTRCVIWAGGIQASEFAGATGLPQGKGGRIDLRADHSVEGAPRVYALGDFANIPVGDGSYFPQLGSVALQQGDWAAEAIWAEIEGKKRPTFHYRDKGIMAMISRGHAIAEVGKHHHQLHGSMAFASWLGIHAYLMTGTHSKLSAFIEWAEDYFSSGRRLQVLDRSNTGRINWQEGEDTEAEPLVSAGSKA